MKIIQTPVRFYPSIGGVEKYVLDLSKELVKRGIEVKIICANEPKLNLVEYQDIKIDRLDYCCKIANTNLTLSLPFRLWREQFDVIHTHLPTPWFADWSAIIGRMKRKKVILTYHNDIIGKGVDGLAAKIYNHTVLKLTLSLVDKIIITQPKYLDYSPHLKKYKKKIVVIPNAIDLERFKPIPNIKKEKNTLFFLCVLDEYHKYKGLNYLLEAIVLIKKEISDIKLIIGGRGKLLNYYRNKAKELEIAQNVEFHGFIPEEKLVEYYNRYQAFVLPSTDYTQEGFGIVLLEALACGMPVVTTNIVGMAKEIRKFNTGMVIKSKNTSQLVNSIKKILLDDKFQKLLYKNRNNLLEMFDLKKLANKFINLYK